MMFMVRGRRDNKDVSLLTASGQLANDHRDKDKECIVPQVWFPGTGCNLLTVELPKIGRVLISGIQRLDIAGR